MQQNQASQIVFNILSEEEMVGFGERLAKACKCIKCIIYLCGDLGAGKTTLARGFLRALGCVGTVKSPTYTIVEPYEISATKVYHFDLYRLTRAEELTDIGALDYFGENAIFLIEWPELGKGILPLADLTCKFDMGWLGNAIDGRLLVLSSNSKIGDVVMENFLKENS